MFAIGAVMTGINSAVFDDYPMGYDESRCSYIIDSPKPAIEPRTIGEEVNQPDEAELEAQYDRCMVQLEKERSIRQITDFSKALGLIVVGVGLFFVHKRMERDSKWYFVAFCISK